MTSNNDPKEQQEPEIPLLEDIVSPEELEIDSEFIDFGDEQTERAASNVPEYDEVLLAMRDDIAHQLQEELHSMVAEAVRVAIGDTTKRVAQILHDELDSTLEHRIRQLIDQRMEAEFGPRDHHAKESDADAG